MSHKDVFAAEFHTISGQPDATAVPAGWDEVRDQISTASEIGLLMDYATAEVLAELAERNRVDDARNAMGESQR